MKKKIKVGYYYCKRCHNRFVKYKGSTRRFCKKCVIAIVRESNPLKERYCKYCGTSFYGTSTKYCSVECKHNSLIKPVVGRSALSARASVYRQAVCSECGTAIKLHAHHVDGNRYNNTPDNIMTLCSSCHVKWHWSHGKVRGKDLKPRKRDGYFKRFANRHARNLCGFNEPEQT